MNETLRQRVSELFHERWEQLGVDGLLPPERDYVLMWSLHTEVSNGGLDQYLFNSSGDLAADTLNALERCGYRDMAAALWLALDVLPGGWCEDRAERQQRLAAVPDRWDLFGAITEEYYQAEEATANQPSPTDGGLIGAILVAYRAEGLLAEPSDGVGTGA